MAATLVRALVLCAFMAAAGVHLHRRSPGAPREAVLPLAAHAHDGARYLLLNADPAGAAASAEPASATAASAASAPPARGGALGTLAWRCRDGDSGVVEEIDLRVRDLMRIPAVAAAAHFLPQALPTGLEVALTLASTHAHDGRLSSAQAGISAGGVNLAHAELGLGRQQTEVGWRWPSGLGSRHFPPLPPLSTLAVVALLPAHLRPGARAALSLPALDPSNWAPAERRDVLVAGEPEEIGTIIGVQTLMRVDELNGARRIATFWCDDSGLVWRARWDDLGLAIELVGRAGAGR